MPRTIYKYVFGSTTTKEVTGTNITPLFVGVDPGSGWLAVWCELDPEGTELATFEFVGTGDRVPEGSYVGSCIVRGGFVWHVYRTE